VQRGHLRPVEDSMSRLADSSTEVKVLTVQEETLVEPAPSVIEGTAPQQQEGTGATVDLVRLQRVQIGQVVAAEHTAVR